MDRIGLIDTYNRMVALMVEGHFRPSYGRRGMFRGFSKKNQEQAEEFLQWLADRDYDPRAYLAGCFAEHNWCYQPLWSRLRNARYRRAYKDGIAWAWWERLCQMEQFSERPAELHPGFELAKARYFATNPPELAAALCFEEHYAGRFDRRSSHCRGCLRKDVCR